MKKVLSTLALLLVFCVLAMAGMEESKVVQFGMNGTSAAASSTTLVGENGYILCKSMYVSCETNASMSMYLATKLTSVQVTSASTTIEIYTQSSNVLNGVTITTNDFLLVRNDTAGYQLEDISAIGVFDSDTFSTIYTIASACTATAKDPVFLIDADDVKTFPCLAAGGQSDLHSIFAGKKDMPIYLTVPTSAGTSVVGGVYAIVQ